MRDWVVVLLLSFWEEMRVRSRESLVGWSKSSHAVRESANSVSPPYPGGGISIARRAEKEARRGLKLESTCCFVCMWIYEVRKKGKARTGLIGCMER